MLGEIVMVVSSLICDSSLCITPQRMEHSNDPNTSYHRDRDYEALGLVCHTTTPLLTHCLTEIIVVLAPLFFLGAPGNGPLKQNAAGEPGIVLHRETEEE